ncbi:subtilase family protein [Streptococcus mitis]|uniref:Subtilase family protein n=1 Tax=Streptococcus mitis TaxID=28037 RepID=A0A081PXV3_STRMT|nr:subtilase family protein [Streptococcus mitis]
MGDCKDFCHQKYQIATIFLLSVFVFGFTFAQVSADEGKIETSNQVTHAVTINKLDDSNKLAPPVTADKNALDSPSKEKTEVTESLKQDDSIEYRDNKSDKNVITQKEKTAIKSEEKKEESAVKSSSSSESSQSQSLSQSGHKEKPNSISSNEMITVPKTWEAGHKGQGTVVAVIDSGLDLNHEVLRISDPSKAKFKNQNDIEKAKKAAGIDYGKWYSDKVVYAYDYFDGTDNIKEAEKESHGMHVTGIVAGNPVNKAPNSEKVYGVAPEAQIMFMRVFSDRDKTTASAFYVKAIDDAVALGADVINMSLGAGAGSTVDAGSDIIEAVKRARAKGVSVVIAAGNSNTFGRGFSQPLAENPDYGLVGNPSTVEDSISVASINNKILTTEVFEVKGLENDTKLDYGKFDFNRPEAEKDFEKGKEYEYVAAGIGREEDFANIDVRGKLALIQRGKIHFSDKIKNALQHGAAGVLIYNNVEGANVSMSVTGDAKKIPSVFISKHYGEILKSGQYKIVFNHKMDNRKSDVADQLSDFSSWGVTTDGQLKPDVTAPGGNIYSSFNDNSYGSISGTSMAAPHIAGVAALVKEYLAKKHPELSASQISEIVKALIMSTAKPHFNKQTGAYTSPRQQGAGVVDTMAATSTDLFVTGTNNYPSVTLGNVGDKFTFEVTIHNISDKDQTLKMVVNTNTDEVNEGKFTLRPRKLTETVWPEVTVKAHSTKTVTVRVDTSKFTEELSKIMPNGYFLEGFVRFVNPADDGSIIGLPFMGFKGEFQNLPAIEKPIYNLIQEGKSGFYSKIDKDNPAISPSDDATYLTSSENDLNVLKAERQGNRVTVLGVKQDAEGKYHLQLDEKGNIRLAISPNDDGNKDSVQFKTLVYRNLVNLRATVYDSSDTTHSNPIWKSRPTDLVKNYFDGDTRNPRSYVLDKTAWGGKDSNGNRVSDGIYDYVISYKPDVPGAEEQYTTFKIQIDTQKPLITSGYIRSQKDQEQFIARKPQDVGNGGILLEKVFYIRPSENRESTDSEIEQYQIIKQNEDGSYTLPKNIDKSKIFYYVEDFAGNVDFISLKNLVGEENSGRVKIAILNNKTKSEIDTTYVYRIKNSEGQYVTVDKSKDINFLKFGHYVAEIFSYDRTELKFVSALSKEFDLTKENSFQTITFLANKMKYAPVTVGFNQAVPGTTTITLVGEDGQSQVLPSETYGKNSYGKKVVPGEYKVLVNLSNGYELLDNLQPFKVLFGQNNVLSLSVVSKLALIAALNKQMEVVKTPRYYNTKQNLKEMFDQSVKDAQLALGSKLNQDKIDQIVKALESAMQTLDGKESDITSLKNAIKAYAETVKKGKYINSDQERKGQYDREFKLLALLITKDLITQDEIDRLLTTFLKAQEQLNGKETDFMSLKNVIVDEVKFQDKDPRFLTASKEEKDAYNLIFRKAKLLLENSEASQEEINAAINALKETTVKLKANKVEIPTKPVAPVKPVDSTKEVAPVKPVDSTKEVAPVKPVDSTKEVAPVKPVNPAKPVVTIKPSNPTKPVVTINPVNPTKPVVTINPVIPAKPVVTIKPANLTKPVVTIKPSNPTKPVVPVKAVNPTKPVVTIKLANPIKPVVPVKAVNPAKPVVTIKPSNPTKPVVTIKPSNPIKPVVPVKAVNPAKPVVPVKAVNPAKPVVPVKAVNPAKQVASIKPVSQVQPVKLVSHNRQVSTIKPSISNDKIEKTPSIIEANHENKTLAGSGQQVLLATVNKEGKQLPVTGENNMISIILSISGISLLLSVIGLATFSKSE